MEFAFTEDQLAIKDSVAKLCAQFDDKYWLKKDKEGGFPNDFYKAMADAGWLGIAMPEEYGGAGLGITEAALVMQTVAESGAALQGASAIHLNIFGPNPIVLPLNDPWERFRIGPIGSWNKRPSFKSKSLSWRHNASRAKRRSASPR